MLVRQNPNVFQTVLDYFRTGYEAMNFESEAEKITSEIFVKKSFVVKKEKGYRNPSCQKPSAKTSDKEIKCQKIMEEKSYQEI